MDLVILRQLLRLAGIRDLILKFDDCRRQIVVTFTQAGENHVEHIDFEDIESFFTEGPAQAPGPPGAEDLLIEANTQPSETKTLERSTGAGIQTGIQARSGPLGGEQTPAGTR